jgi:hypothetical protein
MGGGASDTAVQEAARPAVQADSGSNAGITQVQDCSKLEGYLVDGAFVNGWDAGQADVVAEVTRVFGQGDAKIAGQVERRLAGFVPAVCRQPDRRSGYRARFESRATWRDYRSSPTTASALSHPPGPNACMPRNPGIGQALGAGGIRPWRWWAPTCVPTCSVQVVRNFLIAR